MELIPAPLWGINLRSQDALGKYGWNKLRKDLLQTAKPGCGVCGSEQGRRLGHEVWSYSVSGRSGIARLIGIEFICDMCSSVHHFGRITVLHAEGIMSDDDVEAIIKHFMIVNGCTRREFLRHEAERKAEWAKWSEKRWSVNWGVFADRVRKTQVERQRRGRT